MRDAAAAFDLPLASSPLILRQIYADAPGQGAVVWDMGSRAAEAARELDQLFREILPHAISRDRGSTGRNELKTESTPKGGPHV
jgi:chromosome partitioning protein